MLELISSPWHWAVSGLAIAVVMMLLLYHGERFGVSSSFKAICSMAGAGSRIDYFRYDWKSHAWLLVFVVGSVLGGYLASSVLASPEPVQIATSTQHDLAALGIDTPQSYAEGAGFVPAEIFSMTNLTSPAGVLLLILGGFLIGFGTRWAGGCTSGHAISGLSNLQLPSLVAVIGFFVGGLVMTHLLFPFIFSL
ncbi:MAG: YeeE/YedE family protein [Saprospiraceae bacterium]|nr:YeeE/YedE family protein [Saprospiraceae bacterium]